MAFKVLTFSLLICLVRLSQSEDFPKSIPRCRVTDEECMVKIANDVLHSHPNGFPELNLENLEPFPLGVIRIKGDSSKPVNFDLEMTDLLMSGFSNMTFTKITGFKPEPKDLVIETESNNDFIEIKGKYKIAGKMLVFPITGEGDLSIKIKGLRIKSRSKPKIEVRNGKEYMKLDYYKIKAKGTHMEVALTNLFNGDKILGENMNKIINENWELLWDEMEQSFNDHLAKVNGNKLEKALGAFPYKDLFLSDE